MYWYETEVNELISRLSRQLPLHPAVFYGSSSIRLWSTLSDDLLDSRAVNAGFGGSTLEACVHFYDRIIPPLHPASLVVYAGDNDLGDGRSPEFVADMFGKLLRHVKHRQPAVPFFFLSIKPSPARRGLMKKMEQANEMIRQQCVPESGATYIDIFRPMLHERGLPRPELYLADGLHMSHAGYRLWAEILEPYRNQIFIGGPSAFHPTRLSSGLSEPGIP